jgi:putative endonuclease
MALHNIIGKKGEEIAKKYLESKGYTIVEQNYRTKRAEIDIIAKQKSIMVFVEVRTKQHELFGRPEDTIGRKKRLRLKLHATAYMHWKKQNGPCRIDAVCLIIDPWKGLERLSHYENIGD